jgi:hypothetical protein
MSADHVHRLDDDALGTALADLDLRWPEAPATTPEVLASIRAAERRPAFGVPRLGAPSRRRTILLIAAALLALAAAAGAAKLAFDLGAVTVDRIPGRPTVLPGTTFPGDAVGASVSRDEAEGALGSPFVTPTALGEPDVFWLQEPSLEGAASDPWAVAAWRPTADLPTIDGTEWGAVMIRFRGQADVASKGVSTSGATVDAFELDGRRALWIMGPHELVLPIDGALEHFEVRGNVLLVQDGHLTLRLETALPRTSVVELVRSSL